MRRHNIKFIKTEFEKKGYTFLSKTYLGNKQELDIICPDGHQTTLRYNALTAGRGCKVCAANQKLTYSVIKESFEKEGYELLSKSYVNNKKDIHYICPEGHYSSINWNRWQYGDRCLECSIKNRSGEKSSNWKGGISRDPYCCEWSNPLKRFIKDRDNHICQNPKCNGSYPLLAVHHINYDKLDCGAKNLITVCVSCNSRANVNRDEWQGMYEGIIEEMYCG